MRALCLDSHGVVTLEDVPAPSLQGECLVRVTLAGICGTDLQMLDGYAGFTGIPGHEFVGVVERVPGGGDEWAGKRVVGEINVGCSRCEWCARGVKEHCPTRTVLGIRGRSGAFAEYLMLPASNLHHVPDAIDNEAAVFVEPVAAACQILEQLAVTPTTRVSVIGDGRLGNLTAQVMRTQTPHVTLFGRHERKLSTARKVGIDARSATAQHDQSFDVVIEATGRREGLAQAIELVAARGTIVLKSTYDGANDTPLWPAVVKEVSIIGSRCGPFAPAVKLLASGAVRTAPLVFETFALDAHKQAFGAARSELKVLFDPQRARATARSM